MTYTVLTAEALRAWYVTLTDRLIFGMEGHDGWVPDEVLYLDKSGRPQHPCRRRGAQLWRHLRIATGLVERASPKPAPTARGA